VPVEERGARMPGDRTRSEQKHELAWPKFVEYSKEVLDLVDEFPYEDFVRNASKRANVSVYTVEHRYIRREDSIEGFLKVFRNRRGGRKVVTLNREITEQDYEP